MIERGGSVSLALEALQSLVVLGEMLGQELQGNKARELGVLGLVNHAHPTAAQPLQDEVVRDGVAHQGESDGTRSHPHRRRPEMLICAALTRC